MSRFKKETIWFKLPLILGLVIIIGRLIILQLFDGSYYRVLADENRVKLREIKANRGIIYDRHNEVLVRNTPDGRDYIYGKAMSHVLGYLLEVNEEELEFCSKTESCNYAFKDLIGQMGIEKQYDDVLKGEDGGFIIETDANGKVLRQIGEKDSIAGENIKLSLDAGLQRKAYELMKDKNGALIATKPDSGEILVLVSSPSFDPKKVEDYLNNKDLPLFNRVISGKYPPGSIFKIVTATGALEESKINVETLIEDTGEIVIGPYRFGNWYFDEYGKKEGMLNIIEAIKRSNDVFFYKVGEKLGINKLANWAKYFGLSRVTGIDLSGEVNGLMPDPKWKKEYKGEDWYLGDTYITSIGQGDILMTPLQVNQLTSVIANNGKLCRPQILLKTSECDQLNISQNTIDLVREGMKQVCEAGGTAWPFFDFKINGERTYVAGKTGTAEQGGEHEKPHAWFTAFAPVKEPEIVLTVLLEKAGQGSDEAAPIAKDLLDYWFKRQI